MATLMEKDVLLEYAHIGHLLPDIPTEQAIKDSHEMGKLWRYILSTHHEDLDFDKIVEKIRDLRTKYETVLSAA